MKSFLIVYHSQSGTCARLAQAAHQGAQREQDVRVQVLRAWDADTASLKKADGVLLITAENSGALAGCMKDFLDRVFYPAIEAGIVMPYAIVVSAGNDGRSAAAQAQRIASGIPLVPAAEPLILRGEYDEKKHSQCCELGEALAAGVAMGIY
ncbi:MAG: NAD(P)H-dependent oxidoreductase [Halioglobus sp.]